MNSAERRNQILFKQEATEGSLELLGVFKYVHRRQLKMQGLGDPRAEPFKCDI